MRLPPASVLLLPVYVLVSLCYFSFAQTISSVSPLVRAPGDRITVAGSGFTCSTVNMGITVGTFTASVLSVASTTLITLNMPTGGVGTSLTLTLTFKCFTPIRTRTSALRLSYRNSISGIIPSMSNPDSLVTVSGNNFVSPCIVNVGGILAQSCSFVSSTSASVRVPRLGSGLSLDVTFNSNGVTASEILKFSYSPLLLTVQPTVMALTGAVVTVAGQNFAGSCTSASISIASVNIFANCSILLFGASGRLLLSVPPLSTSSASTTSVTVAATINGAQTSAAFVFQIGSGSSSVAASPSSASNSASIVTVVVISVVSFFALFGVFVIARRRGWCQKSPEVRYERPPAYAPPMNSSDFGLAHFVAQQPRGPDPKSIERAMASAPPSDSVERQQQQWAGYMAAYDARQQEHMMASVVAGNAADALPRRAALAADEFSMTELASAPPSDTMEREWSGYLAAFDARLQNYMGSQVQGPASAPPADDADVAYSQAVNNDRFDSA